MTDKSALQKLQSLVIVLSHNGPVVMIQHLLVRVGNFVHSTIMMYLALRANKYAYVVYSRGVEVCAGINQIEVRVIM